MSRTTANKITLEQVLAVLPPGERVGDKTRTECPVSSAPSPRVSNGSKAVVVKCWTDGCHSGAAWRAIKKLLPKPTTENVASGLTVAQYAAMKGLNASWLQLMFGIYDAKWRGKPAVALPYHDEQGGLAGIRFRISAEGDEQVQVETRRPLLALRIEIPMVEGDYDLVLVGGRIGYPNSRSQRQRPAFSGAKTWKKEWAELARIPDASDYPQPEPGRRGISSNALLPICRPPKFNIIPFSEQTKDPSALHMTTTIAKPQHVVADTLPAGFDSMSRREQFQARKARRMVIEESGFFKEFEAACANALTLDGIAVAPPRPFTDSGNAEMLVDMYGKRLFGMYSMTEAFYVWDGKVWMRDERGVRLLPYTKDVARSILDETCGSLRGAGKRKTRRFR